MKVSLKAIMGTLLSKGWESKWGWQGQGKPLKPYPGTVPCRGCGHCCRTSACSYGQWDAKKGQCDKLVDEGGVFRCSRYQEIINLPPEEWVMSPAFGCGCSSPGART